MRDFDLFPRFTEARATVQMWEKGSEPKHSDGQDLLALLAQVSKQASMLKGLSSVSRSE